MGALEDTIPAAVSAVSEAEIQAEAAPPAVGDPMPGANILDELVTRLQKSFGNQLISVVLYGSAAVGDHDRSYSDYNVLCVLDQVTPRELARAEEIFRWFRERGNPAPLLLSEREAATSTDCFPIEFYDIRAQHRILHGRDIVDGIDIDMCFYRAQVEHELRSKLLRLRQKASGVLSEKDLLRQLLADSLSTFCVLFRHSLILTGHEAPARKRDVIAQCARSFDFDAAGFDRLLDLREEKIKPRDLDPGAVLEGYLRGIGAVVDAVDRVAK
jgi:predicted nucleotidyltransferase